MQCTLLSTISSPDSSCQMPQRRTLSISPVGGRRSVEAQGSARS